MPTKTPSRAKAKPSPPVPTVSTERVKAYRERHAARLSAEKRVATALAHIGTFGDPSIVLPVAAREVLRLLAFHLSKRSGVEGREAQERALRHAAKLLAAELISPAAQTAAFSNPLR
jgi:regulator of protease activity HflC (stomatin/prohibitin superfamily)